MKRHNFQRRSRFHGAAGIDFYACQSRLRSWNSCYKVGAAVWLLLLCIALDRTLVSVFVIASMGILNVKGNQVEFRAYFGLLKIPIAFLVMGSMAIALGISAEPAGDWNLSLSWCYLYADRERVVQAAELFLKAMGAVSVLYALSLSTPMGELAAALNRMHIPKLVTELMSMVYRFIFILAEVHRTMKTAAVSRLGDADFKTSCSTFGQIGGNLLILSLKRANACYDAMVSRGYEGELPFWGEEKPVTIWQAAALAGDTILMGVLYYFSGG